MKSFGSISHFNQQKESNKHEESDGNNFSTRDDQSRSHFRTQKNKGESKIQFLQKNGSKSPSRVNTYKHALTPVKSDLSNSMVCTINSNIGVKKQNQLYSRTLEEFAESNIKWINDLVEYKQIANHTIIQINTKIKGERNAIDYERKRQSQLKSEIKNISSGNISLRAQNNDMLNKIKKLRSKINSRNEEYSKMLSSTEKLLLDKKDGVDQLFHEITCLNDFRNQFCKEAKENIKQMELNILDAEKALWRLNENIAIARQYEAHRIQILRDKQKMLGDVIWKDSYQYF